MAVNPPSWVPRWAPRFRQRTRRPLSRRLGVTAAEGRRELQGDDPGGPWALTGPLERVGRARGWGGPRRTRGAGSSPPTDPQTRRPATQSRSGPPCKDHSPPPCPASPSAHVGSGDPLSWPGLGGCTPVPGGGGGWYHRLLGLLQADCSGVPGAPGPCVPVATGNLDHRYLLASC